MDYRITKFGNFVLLADNYDRSEDYVREQIEYTEMAGSPAVLAEWKAFYDYL